MREGRDGGGHAPDVGTRKVLIVTDSLDNGGLERQLDLLARSLPDSWAVKVVGLKDGVFANVIREHGLDLTLLPRKFRFDVSPATALGAIIGEWRPDVVHAYGWMSSAAALPACRRYRIPLVDASIRDGAVSKRRGKTMRFVSRFADVVIANSQAGLDAFGVGPERGRVVRNGFDPDRWELCTPVPHEPGTPFTAVMTGRMHAHKDWRTYLDAARLLGREEPEGWRFLAVGRGEQREELRAEYADVEASGVLEFPDGGTEVLGLVRRSDVGVLLTDAAQHAEGIPNSVMEYMACSLPAICTDSGGNRELVIDGETGVLIGSGDLDGLVTALRALRDDPEMAGRMGAEGRARIESVFTVDALVEQTVAAYELARARRGTA